MKKVILQYWEESERGWGVRPDGCSIHHDIKSHGDYIKTIYEKRDCNFIPDEYDRIVGHPIEIEISESLFGQIKENGSLRLFEYEMNNLLKMKEIKL